jgi:hypothetical protein
MNALSFLLVTAVLLSACPAVVAGKADHPAKLMAHFGALQGGVGKKNIDKVKIISGPAPVEMLNDKSPGQVWQASLGTVKFKITIQDATRVRIEECFERLQKLPPAYRAILPIVSEGDKAGLALYAKLGGAAAHGSQDYLNVVPTAGAQVILHEAGHILEQRVTSVRPDTLERWKKAIADDKVSVSAYGDQVAHEDLAEFSLVYAACLDAGAARLAELQKMSPKRFALWADILKTAPTLPPPQKKGHAGKRGK